MPRYYTLKRKKKTDRDRIIKNLLALRRSLKKEMPERTADETLLLATWNIRDFDSNKFGHGPRLPESFHYIAEIIAAFDLVAVQEVNENMSALEKVMFLLGPTWDFISTDVTEGKSGNQERMVFLYDTRKVRFLNIAGEIVLQKGQKIENEKQFARTPYIVSFQSGWFKFSLCTVHLYYGASSGKKLQTRIKEIQQISKFLAKRAKKEKSNIILLGDFNIVHPEHDTMKGLTKNGFVVPKELQDTTNMGRDKYYDQIAFMLKKNKLQLGDSDPHAGVYDLYNVLYKPDSYSSYYNLVKNKKKWDFDDDDNPQTEAGKKNYFTKKWRTFQMSDHLPLWVELKIDFSDEYLNKINT